MNSNIENLKNKISYRSKYRGTKEMDIFVSSFVNSIVNKLNLSQLNDLNKIINLNDEEILELCEGKIDSNNFNVMIISKLREFKKSN